MGVGGGGVYYTRQDQEMCVMHSKISSFCRKNLSVTSVYHIMLGAYHLLSPVQ